MKIHNMHAWIMSNHRRYTSRCVYIFDVLKTTTTTTTTTNTHTLFQFLLPFRYAAIDRIPTIDTGTGNDDDNSAAPKLPKIQIQGNITFNHVDFSYVGIDGNERPVFNDLSIDIKAGETVA